MSLTILTIAPKTDIRLESLWLRSVDKFFPDASISLVHPNNKLPKGSTQHGEGLNRALKQVRTSHTLILDLDCILISNDWYDDKLQSLAGIKTGTNNLHMCFLLAPTTLLNCYDFTPIGGGLSFPPDRDVGARLPIINADLSIVNCKSGKCSLIPAGYQFQEINYKGEVIACHWGRGSNATSKKSKTGVSLKDQRQFFFDFCEEKIGD